MYQSHIFLEKRKRAQKHGSQKPTYATFVNLSEPPFADVDKYAPPGLPPKDSASHRTSKRRQAATPILAEMQITFAKPVVE